MSRPKLPLSKQIAFSIGQLGWAILMGLINSYLVYFYSPPESAEIPYFIPQGNIFGIFTIIGLITIAGRALDAITDPWIATLSDRHKSPKGRRIPFLKMAVIPFSVLTVLIFWPPVDYISGFNVVWLTITLLTFYIFYTMYVTPYFALIPELGKTANERLNLSTYISVTFFLGTAVASQAAMIWNKLAEMGIDKVMAIRYTFIGLAGLSLLFLMFPIWFIDERKYSESKPSEINMMEALKSAFSKREFRVFAISDLSYFLALTILQTGLIYYITVLLELPESLYSTVFIMLGVLSFLFYPFVNLTAKKIGKKKLMIIAFSFFTIMYLLVFTLGMNIWFIPNNIQIYILIALAAFPMAVFGILPNAILSDIAEHDAVTTGNKKEAIFYGVRTLMSKVGQMLSMFIFSSLLLFGKDIGDSLGIRLTGPVAAVFSFIGLIFFLMYDEKKMLSVNNKE